MPVNPPTDRRYLQSHEWHQISGDTATIGITQQAADELTDITYVKLPAVGTKVSANQPWGEIESVKATSDLYSGLSGTVTAVNEQLSANPGVINTDPYNAGWMIRIKLSNPAEADQLLSADDYVQKTAH